MQETRHIKLDILLEIPYIADMAATKICSACDGDLGKRDPLCANSAHSNARPAKNGLKYTVTEAADLLGVSRQQIYNWQQEGKIRRFGPRSRVVYLVGEDVLALLNRPKPGRKPGYRKPNAKYPEKQRPAA
jgi:excisionase family DNA binding protein